ncbi:MAG: carbonic anhydrase [Pseudomonadota bacterium]|nr:carbonic anhydrase [Pseudomonadota bacterium]
MTNLWSRRRLLLSGALGVAAAAAEPAIALAALDQDVGDAATVTPEQALRLLVAGNRRWVSGRVRHPNQSVARRERLALSQHPFATVFSCIDSRVPPELVFDRGIGDLAVVRTGAQVLDRGIVLGSVEFAGGLLHTPLILVMGHQRCGAVKSAIELIENGDTAPGHIQSVVDALRPAHAAAKHEPGNQLENTVQAQTRLTVKELKSDPFIRDLIDRGELRVHGAYYSLDTGRASIIA